MTLEKIFISSPLGNIAITGHEDGISEIQFVGDEKGSSNAHSSCLIEAKTQLEEYFARTRKGFNLPLTPAGTNFQQEVWKRLSEIPYGVTVSYLHIANQLDNPKATRAVGAANGKNPLAIVVPCHRVIGSNHTLTGYAGGVWRKKWLLEFEKYGHQGNLF